jgi:hypothetical protein
MAIAVNPVDYKMKKNRPSENPPQILDGMLQELLKKLVKDSNYLLLEMRCTMLET